MVGDEQLVVGRADQRYPAVGHVVGAEDVEHGPACHLHRNRLAAHAVARNQHPLGRVIKVPQEREVVARRQDLVGVVDRPVEEDRVPLGEREVMHHRAAVGGHVHGTAHPAARVHHLVGHVVPAVVVAHAVQFARARVAVRVPGP